MCYNQICKYHSLNSEILGSGIFLVTSPLLRVGRVATPTVLDVFPTYSPSQKRQPDVRAEWRYANIHLLSPAFIFSGRQSPIYDGGSVPVLRRNRRVPRTLPDEMRDIKTASQSLLWKNC